MDYVVFSPTGIPTARVSTRPEPRLLDIGEDYVVLLTRDELDREIVSRHRLSRSDG